MFDLVRGLSRDSSEPVVVSPNDGPYYRWYADLGVPLVDLPLRRLNPQTLLALIGLIRTYRIDLIHSHGKGAGIYGRIAAFLTRTPVVHSFHGLHYRAYGATVSRAYLLLEVMLARLTTRFIHVSRSEMDEAIALGISQPSRAAVVYNGLDCAEIDQIRVEKARKLVELGLREGGHLVATVARISPAKGLEYLAEAVPIILSSAPGTRFLLIGDAPAGDERTKTRLQSLISERGLGDTIRMTGYRTDVVELLKCVDVYVSSSLWEGMPISILEAMACAKPVVATDVGGNSEAVVDSETGFLVPPKDPRGIAQGVATLIRDRDLRTRFGQAGRQRVEKLFSMNRVISEIEAIYGEALKCT